MPLGTLDPDQPLYLRIGDWDVHNPRSINHASGYREVGLSAYDLDEAGCPVAPEESEWAYEDMRDRLLGNLPKYLVQGGLVGVGHDGEPLLENVVVVGSYLGLAGKRGC